MVSSSPDLPGSCLSVAHGDLGLQLFFRGRQHLAAPRAEVPSRGVGKGKIWSGKIEKKETETIQSAEGRLWELLDSDWYKDIKMSQTYILFLHYIFFPRLNHTEPRSAQLFLQSSSIYISSRSLCILLLFPFKYICLPRERRKEAL